VRRESLRIRAIHRHFTMILLRHRNARNKEQQNNGSFHAC
jgi:hypothetical protein